MRAVEMGVLEEENFVIDGVVDGGRGVVGASEETASLPIPISSIEG